MRNLAGIYPYCTNCKHYEENKPVKGLELGRNGRTRNKVYTVYQWCDKSKKGITTGVCLCDDFEPKLTLEEFRKTDDYLNRIVEVKDGQIIRARDLIRGNDES